MNHPDVDPSLRAAEPLLESLDDGFSPPVLAPQPPETGEGRTPPAEPTLGPKSPY